jgi:hypothetical protein
MFCANVQAETVSQHEPLERATEQNLVVLYFMDADLQAETRAQLREVKRALDDMLTQPVSTLRANRYADYMMKPGQWTLGMLLNAYFMSVYPQETDSLKFYEDSKKPEAIIILKEKMMEVEKSIPNGAGE